MSAANGNSLDSLVGRGFKTIVADPPWKYGKWGLFGGGDENTQPPGRGFTTDNPLPYPAMTVAEIAGVQAAKRTSELIPLCHPLALTNVKVTATLEDGGVLVTAEARCVGRTGVEMEALTATSVALLTVYDMCKAVDKDMHIAEIVLREKTKEDLAPSAG